MTPLFLGIVTPLESHAHPMKLELLFGVTQMKNKLGFDYIKIYSTQILAQPFCDRLNAMCFSTINLFCNIAVCIPTVPLLQNCIEMLSFSAANSTAGKSKVMRPIKQWVRLKLNQIFTICKQEVTQVLELLDKSTAQQPLIGPIIHRGQFLQRKRCNKLCPPDAI